MAEIVDLKSIQCGFDPHLGYHLKIAVNLCTKGFADSGATPDISTKSKLASASQGEIGYLSSVTKQKAQDERGNASEMVSLLLMGMK